jgi:uncharacterized protein (TIGR03435 family)
MLKNLSTALAVLLAVSASALLAQAPGAASTPGASPGFEVASIKQAPPIEPMKVMSGQMHVGMSIDAARVDIGNLSLTEIIRTAYRMKGYQISGPDWMSAQRFDIMAKMPEGSSKDKVPEMLQALLADRFKMTAHRETKDFPAYALIVGKNGPKLREAEAAVAPQPAADGEAPGKPAMVVGSGDTQVRVQPNPDGKGATVASPQFGQMKVSMGDGGMMRMEFARMSMQLLADTLARFTGKPVVDMTELTGTYQVTLDLSLDDMRNVAMAAGMGPAMGGGGGMMGRPRGGEGEAARGPAESASTPGGSSIFNAIQSLGLKLDARKLPIETLVVDHLEKTPTEN